MILVFNYLKKLIDQIISLCKNWNQQIITM